MRTLTESERIARAYATLGVPADASEEQTTREYRRLVKRWHPDQYATDPQGQAEAGQRMRQINAAFATIRPLLRARARNPSPPIAPRPSSSQPSHSSPSSPFGGRLRQEEVDAIVESMRGASMFEGLFGYLTRALAFVGGVIYTSVGLGYHKPVEAVCGVALLLFAGVSALRDRRG